MRQTRRWLGLAFLVAGATAVGIVVGEVGLRLFYPQQLGVWHQDREGLGLHWAGLVTYWQQSSLTVSFNSVGMRDREHTLAKSEGVFRILVLGDSFMEALQVPFDASFSSRLERELEQRAARPIEVVTAGVSGWGTDDELKYLTRYGMKWKPDLILVAMTLHNDISDNLQQRFHTIRNGDIVEQPPPRETPLRYQILQLKAFLATRYHTYQLLRRAQRAREVQDAANDLNAHVVDLFRPVISERISKGIELTTLLLKRMQAIASSAHSRVVVVLVPLALQVSNERLEEFARSAAGASSGLEIDKPQRLVSRACDPLGIAVIDLLPAFREWSVRGGGALYLERDGHWNERGHRLAADVAARDLIARHLVGGQ